MGGPIRIVHVITRMVRGGAQENTLANVAAFRSGGWESTLLTGPAIGAEGSLEPECRAAGIDLVPIPSLVREISPAADFRAMMQLVGEFRRRRPHLVHTHTSKAGILGRAAARTARVPAVVHTPHGHVFYSYESRARSRLFEMTERACAGLADRLVALTPTEQDEHLELNIGKASQWRIIHSGVKLDPYLAAPSQREDARRELGLRESTLVLGTVGRLVPIKGQSVLLEAVALLKQDFPDLRLLMVGDGPLRASLVEQARGLGLDVWDGEAPPPSDLDAVRRTPVVQFLGLRTDVPRWMAAMDLFVLPSLNEGMGRVLVEAMAAGLPCVGSKVSGIPDVIADGVTGLVVPPGDPGALAEQLSRLLSNPSLCQSMGDRGRDRVVPDFGVERMLEKLEDLYREVLAEKGIALPDRSAPGASI